MNLIELLPVEVIIADLRGSSRDTLFAELCEPLVAIVRIPAVELAAALAEREALASTALGSGIAVPHGVHPRLDRVVASFGRAREGVQFDAPDGLRVHFFVALLRSPEASGAHLKALARVSQLLAHAPVRAALLAAPDAAAMHDIIRERAATS